MVSTSTLSQIRGKPCVCLCVSVCACWGGRSDFWSIPQVRISQNCCKKLQLWNKYICIAIHSCKTVFSWGLNILKLKFQMHVKCKIISKNGSTGKESACNAGDIGDVDSIPGSGRCPGGENDNLLQYSWLENPRDREAWRVTDHRVARSRTWLKWLSKEQICTKDNFKNCYFYIELSSDKYLNIKNYITWIIISGNDFM